MSTTPAQQAAIAARGNVLVMAGAGAGKTSTLVQRCLHCLLSERPPISLDQLLLVTFTEAAAADMRRKIRAALEEMLQAARSRRTAGTERLTTGSELVPTPSIGWLTEQLALFETAHIGTLHSFCLQLVRQHFYELELDPQLAMLAEEEGRLMEEETLDKILNAHYAGDSKESQAVQSLIRRHGDGRDQPIRRLVFQLHEYTQTLRDPAGWLAEQRASFESADPVAWRAWLAESLPAWRTRWLPLLQNLAAENGKAVECAALIEALPANPSSRDWRAAMEAIGAASTVWPVRKKAAWGKPLEKFFEETDFLRELLPGGAAADPLAQDWEWARGPMSALVGLAQEFSAAFTEAKRELAVLDFHDLEQHALRLLWDKAAGEPTATAREWREKLSFVFVDEYQDINDAQDAILRALSREGGAANRFLVGDVKQSIYRFRLADPRIFQRYVEDWSRNSGQVIPLVDNFRSREGVLDFVNSLFGALMKREIGGVPYDEAARLRFGDPGNRKLQGVAKGDRPRVELHLRLTGGDAGEANEETPGARQELMNLEEAAKEARLIARRLMELKSGEFQVWDEGLKAERPVAWRDMAVLLRAPGGKAESFAREFNRQGIPLRVARGGFYDSPEIADLLAVLHLLDNPLQDLPLLSVLRSPLAALGVDELATVRLCAPKAHFWTALSRFYESQKHHAAWPKVDVFLRQFAVWRRRARRDSLSRCLEAVLGETHYDDWLAAQPRGERRRGNVRRLVALTRQFDQFQRQGLFRFLRFIEAQQAAGTEPEVAPVADGDAVSLMSIHQSKGLEFPVVMVADLGKRFNLADLKAEIILDAEYGLSPRIKPPSSRQRYPSLPWHLAQQRQTREMLGEEMRLLYVAMTRARDLLILTGQSAQKRFVSRWSGARLDEDTLLWANSCTDWIAAWGGAVAGGEAPVGSGRNQIFGWTIYQSADQRLLDTPPQEIDPRATETSRQSDAAFVQHVRDRLAWQYPHQEATSSPAKASVTALRRKCAEDAADAAASFQFRFLAAQGPARPASRLSAVDVGLAHHFFLQFMRLEGDVSSDGLRREARRLETAKVLTAEAVAALDFDALVAFWESDLGAAIRANAASVRRELAFTARFSREELIAAGVRDELPPPGEFMIVQGAADLAVVRPEEIWLVDFKTDRFAEHALAEKIKTYAPQLKLYALALSRIYGKSVSQAHLHFLSLRRSVSLDLEASAPPDDVAEPFRLEG